MKSKLTPEAREARPVRIQFQVQFSRGPKGRQRLREARGPTAPSAATVQDPAPWPQEVATGLLPRITLLLVLGHRIEAMIRAGEFRDLADAARVIGITKARVTQVTNLTLLAPAIQDQILALPRGRKPRETLTEREVRSLGVAADWDDQWRVWRRFQTILLRFPSSLRKSDPTNRRGDQ